jgi:hypothetical protein
VVQNLLPSRLLYKNVKTKIPIYETIILPLVLYGRDTWSLTSINKVFENGELRGTFGHKRS